MTEAKQLLRDKNIPPTDLIIANGLGKAESTYTLFLERLREFNISLMEWRYYNDGNAWLSKGEYTWTTVRGTQKIRPIFWLSIWHGFFKISFFFSTQLQADLLCLPISNDAKEMIKNSIPMGKTNRFIAVIFDIRNNEQLDDIFVLSNFKKEKK